jgi:hypothetical protein
MLPGMCPSCGWTTLKIKRREGIERILILFTGKRKYLCVACYKEFRMPDRRRSPREREQVVGALGELAGRK